MCSESHATRALAPAQPYALADSTPRGGSRRRRIWELPDHAHCPVVGVCLQVATLRRLAAKVLGGEPVLGDYDLHRGVINDCRRRTTMAEAVQRELDRRYAPAVRQSAACKHDAELAFWWRGAEVRGDVDRRRPGHLPDRLPESCGLPARQIALQAHGQTLPVRPESKRHQLAARARRAAVCDRRRRRGSNSASLTGITRSGSGLIASPELCAPCQHDQRTVHATGGKAGMSAVHHQPETPTLARDQEGKRSEQQDGAADPEPTRCVGCETTP